MTLKKFYRNGEKRYKDSITGKEAKIPKVRGTKKGIIPAIGFAFMGVSNHFKY